MRCIAVQRLSCPGYTVVTTWARYEIDSCGRIDACLRLFSAFFDFLKNLFRPEVMQERQAV
jgi:hypothetical protein